MIPDYTPPEGKRMVRLRDLRIGHTFYLLGDEDESYVNSEKWSRSLVVLIDRHKEQNQ
jgi:hypothetical protein